METAKKDCQHKDCMYRREYHRYVACEYLIKTGEPRGCSIKGCNKYKPKEKNNCKGGEYEFI